MRRVHLLALAALTLLPSSALAQSAPPTLPTGLPAGPLSAKNVEFIRNVPTVTDSAGGRLVGRYFYLTTERDLTIYDTSTPEDPKAVGYLSLGDAAGQYYFPQEDVDTNGKVLLTSNAGAVEVIDVRDKTAPKLVGRLPGTAQHTISCVLDCTYAYGSEGSIVDLRDPSAPRLAGSWTTGRATSNLHDVTEVAPGIVLTSSQPMYLLDARVNPEQPTTLARIANPDKRFIHANLWPNAMRDDILLVGGEGSETSCPDDPDGRFMTWSTKNWQTDGFRMLDEFSVPRGTVTDGRFPASSYCSHWFTTQPSYRNGGLIADSWYEHGTRFLQIARDGKISEVGWFLPLGGTSSAAYWITDRILYLTDYNRGLDVVRWTGDIVPGEPPPPAGP